MEKMRKGRREEGEGDLSTSLSRSASLTSARKLLRSWSSSASDDPMEVVERGLAEEERRGGVGAGLRGEDGRDDRVLRLRELRRVEGWNENGMVESVADGGFRFVLLPHQGSRSRCPALPLCVPAWDSGVGWPGQSGPDILWAVVAHRCA